MKNRKVSFLVQWLLLVDISMLIIMTLLRIVFVNVFSAPSTFANYPKFSTFLLGMRFDCRDIAIVSTLVFLLAIFTPLNPFKKTLGRKISFTIWILAAILFSLFYIVDFANYSYLQERLNADLLTLMENSKDAAGMVWQTYPVILLLILWIVGVVLVYGIAKFWFKKVSKGMDFPVAKKNRIISGIAFFILMAFFIFGRLGQYPLRWSDAFTFGNDYAAKVSLNPFQSFFSSLKYRKEHLNIADVRKAYPAMIDYLNIEHPDSNTLNYTRNANADTANKPNVVVVICESFSFYKSSMSGNKLDPTPYFNQMCKNGILFDRCFTPSYGTARGVWAVFTGIPDVDLQNTSSRNPKAVNQHSIMNDFKGYDKMYFIGGSLSWANIRGVLTNNVSDLHTFEQDDYEAPKIDVWGVSDKNVFLKANQVFAQQKKPFMAIIQTSDNHRPYTIPDEDKNTFKVKTASDKELHDNGFDNNPEYNAFRYTDFCYETFIEAAKKEPYFKNTIFVFVGDHGIRGDANTMYPNAWTEELTSEHVPLLFYSPGHIQPQLIHHIASQVDLLPTAAGLAKINYTNTTLGHDLLSPYWMENSDKYGALIYDYVSKSIGVVKDSVYYSFGIHGDLPEKAVSIENNQPVNLDASKKAYYHNLTNSLYTTSTYMLTHNKVK